MPTKVVQRPVKLLVKGAFGGLDESQDVAFLTFRVGRVFLDGLRDGLLVFFVGVVLFCVAAAVYFLADLLVAAAPVVMLASGITVPGRRLPEEYTGIIN